jgi:hypothetical protein
MKVMEEVNEIERQKRTHVQLHWFMDGTDCCHLRRPSRRLYPFDICLQRLLTSDERTQAMSGDQVSLEGRMFGQKAQ